MYTCTKLALTYLRWKMYVDLHLHVHCSMDFRDLREFSSHSFPVIQTTRQFPCIRFFLPKLSEVFRLLSQLPIWATFTCNCRVSFIWCLRKFRLLNKTTVEQKMLVVSSSGNGIFLYNTYKNLALKTSNTLSRTNANSVHVVGVTSARYFRRILGNQKRKVDKQLNVNCTPGKQT